MTVTRSRIVATLCLIEISFSISKAINCVLSTLVTTAIDIKVELRQASGGECVIPVFIF